METENNWGIKQYSSCNRLVTDERYEELKKRMQELLKKHTPVKKITHG